MLFTSISSLRYASYSKMFFHCALCVRVCLRNIDGSNRSGGKNNNTSSSSSAVAAYMYSVAVQCAHICYLASSFTDTTFIHHIIYFHVDCKSNEYYHVSFFFISFRFVALFYPRLADMTKLVRWACSLCLSFSLGGIIAHMCVWSVRGHTQAAWNILFCN